MIVSCVSILLSIYFLEIALWIYPVSKIIINDPYQFTKFIGNVKCGIPFNSYKEIYPLKFDKRGYYKKSGGAVYYYFNQYGARWLKAKEQKVGDKNIVVLGDSFTYGFGLRYQDTYICRAQACLNSKGTNLSLMNFSVPASNSETVLNTYNTIKDRVPHAMILYGLHLNDLIAFPTSYVICNTDKHDMWIRNYKSIDFILSCIEKIISRQKNIRTLLDPSNFGKPYFINNMNAIKQLNMEAKKRGVGFSVIILPILVDVRSGTFNAVYYKIKQDLINNGIECLDLSSSVSSYRRDSDLWILPFDQHPNEIANRIFAEGLSKYLGKIFL